MCWCVRTLCIDVQASVLEFRCVDGSAIQTSNDRVTVYQQKLDAFYQVANRSKLKDKAPCYPYSSPGHRGLTQESRHHQQENTWAKTLLSLLLFSLCSPSVFSPLPHAPQTMCLEVTGHHHCVLEVCKQLITEPVVSSGHRLLGKWCGSVACGYPREFWLVLREDLTVFMCLPHV